MIQRETQATLLAALFRVLILMISATPYDLDALMFLFPLYNVCVIDSMLVKQICSDAKGVVAISH